MAVKSWIEIFLGSVLGFAFMMLWVRYMDFYVNKFPRMLIPCDGITCLFSTLVAILLLIGFYIALYFLIRHFSQKTAIVYAFSLMLTLLALIGYYLYVGLVLQAFNESMFSTKVEEPWLLQFLQSWILE